MSDHSSVHFQLQRLILPVVSKNKVDGSICSHGTGFIILACGRMAYIATAAHVIDAIRRIENPHLTYHPTTPEFFRPVRHLLTFNRVVPLVLLRDSFGSGHPAIIETCVQMTKADLALCRIEFPETVPQEVNFDTRLVLDTTPVMEGQEVYAFGYTRMSVESGGGQSTDDSRRLFDARWNVRIATVAAVYPNRGPTGQEHPCFLVSAPLDSGMSGGPVMSKVGDGTPCVRGVARSDETRATNLTSVEPPPTALVSMLWPIMLMPLTGPKLDGSVGERKLIELQQQGTIVDKGRAAEHVRFTLKDNGQIEDAVWSER